MELSDSPQFDFNFPGWPETIFTLTKRGNLSYAWAHSAMVEILSGRANEMEMSAFLAALRTKGEMIEEMSGFADSMLSFATKVAFEGEVVDTCGTGGDKKGTVNVSTTAALILAGAGVTVCKHGGRASSSLSGSADVLEQLGVVIDLGPAGVAKCMEEAKIGFCFAPTFHPAMANVSAVRRGLKIPTVFNFLGPLVNPALAKRQLVGISDPEIAESMAGVLGRIGSHSAMVVYGDDGLDEVTTTGISHIIQLTRDETGKVSLERYDFDPLSVGIKRAKLEDLAGGDAKYNAEALVSILEGNQGACRDIAVLNAACALVVAGAAKDIEGGLDLADRSISSGGAKRALEQLIETSTRMANPISRH